MTEDFKPNSDVSRKAQERPEAQRVTTGHTTRRTQSAASRVLYSLLPTDVRSMTDDIRRGITDDFVPSIRHAVYECIVSGIRVIFGEPAGRSSYADRYAPASYRTYSTSAARGAERAPAYSRPNPNAGMRYRDVIFEERGDAEVVLFSMEERLNDYEVVSVADFLDLSGEKSQYVDNKFGWYDLSGARVERVRDGYIINLPKAVDIRS